MLTLVYAYQKPPDTITRSIFLAGPTPRSPDVPSWRPEAVRLLEAAGYDGVVFIPEAQDGKYAAEYEAQCEWEEKSLHMADCILFWLPRDLKTMPGFTTNDEWGVWKASGKVVFGAPPEAKKIKYQEHYAHELDVPRAHTLAETVQLAVEMVREGADRSGGEREVPLMIWRTAHFQEWYARQGAAGNRLDGARVAWSVQLGASQEFFFWALQARLMKKFNQKTFRELVVSLPEAAHVAMSLSLFR